MKAIRYLTVILLLLSITLSQACRSKPGVTPADPSTDKSTQRSVSKDLMASFTSSAAEGRATDGTFIQAITDFAINLYKQTSDKEKSSLVSPLSVLVALSMTANGAKNNTLSEMINTLAPGLDIEELNKYLLYYISDLPSNADSSFKCANSIWIRNSFEENIKDDFLSANAKYYKSGVFSSDFSDPGTVKDINSWIKENTDGMIDNMINDISSETVMYLINAIAFNALWENEYTLDAIINGVFHGAKDTDAEYMHSKEYVYLESDDMTGFIKPYKGNNYCFIAMLPNEDTDINVFISSLTAQKWHDIYAGRQNAAAFTLYTSTPKFSYEYSIDLNDPLKSLGIKEAFDSSNADMSGMSDVPMYISNVLHKTFISVDELGTKAGAATVVSMNTTSLPQEVKNVYLDRPFVYAIADSVTGYPIFIGTYMG